MARAGFFPRLRGVLGVAAWPAEAVARPAGAAVATPRAPFSFSSAAAAAAGEAPVARAGSVPRVGGVLGVAAWPAEAVSRPVGVAAAAPRAPSSLSFAAAEFFPRLRGVLGVAAWSAEAVVRPAGAAVAIPRAPFLLSSAAAAALGSPAPGLSPVSAACRGPRSGPRRGSLGLRSPLPARLGPPPGAGRRGWLLGWRRRPSRPAQAPGPAAAARPAPPPPPASAPRAPRGSPPSTPGRRRGSGSGTGGGGGRPAGGTHRSLPSLLPW